MRSVGRWIRRSRMQIAVSALTFYAAAIPATLLIFPDNNVWLALLVIVASLAQSLLSIAELLEDE